MVRMNLHPAWENIALGSDRRDANNLADKKGIDNVDSGGKNIANSGISVHSRLRTYPA